MKVRQRVYFFVESDVVDPDQVSEHLGIAPDEASKRGSRRQEPSPLPRYHSWKLNSPMPEDTPLDDQFDALLDRITSVAERLAALVSTGDVGVGVQVVRYFEPGAEDDAVLERRDENTPTGLQILRGQHPLLGFHLDAARLARLAALRASLDFDEYGDEFD